MNCELAHERMVTAAYAELPDEQMHELERHVTGCPECHGEQEQLRALMATVQGRQYSLGVIFEHCGVLQASFVPKDSMAGAFNEGRRSVGLALLAQIDQYAPDLLLVARREQLDRAQPTTTTSAKPTQETTTG